MVTHGRNSGKEIRVNLTPNFKVLTQFQIKMNMSDGTQFTEEYYYQVDILKLLLFQVNFKENSGSEIVVNLPEFPRSGN